VIPGVFGATILPGADVAEFEPSSPAVVVWTDDHGNVLRLVRW
jgi:hypothetical protein